MLRNIPGKYDYGSFGELSHSTIPSDKEEFGSLFTAIMESLLVKWKAEASMNSRYLMENFVLSETASSNKSPKPTSSDVSKKATEKTIKKTNQ